MLVVNNFWRKLMTLKRHRVTDKESAAVLTTKKLGATQSLTPEGFLLCQGVPIKRTGTMMYGPGETPIKPGKDGLSWVTRDASALFVDPAVASYMGKPVVNDHPPEDVTPANWKKYAIGTVLNPRRGDGYDNDVLLADLLITDAGAIRDVQAGKRDVSAGYDADYEQTGEGEGRQTNIIGNHVALVTKGRCGPRCSIGDSQPSTSKGSNPMATKNARPRVKLAEAIRAAFKDAGDNMAETLANSDVGQNDGGAGDDDSDDNHTHVHLHMGGGESGGTTAAGPASGDDAPGSTNPMEGVETQDDPVEARFQALEQQIAQILQIVKGGGPATQDDAVMGPAGVDTLLDGKGDTSPGGANPADGLNPGLTKDSAALATGFQKVLADAEILVPGVRIPTFDAALPRAKTVDNICRFRRSVLNHLALTTDGVALLASVTEGPVKQLDGLSCNDVAGLFNSAAVAKRAINHRAATGDGKLGAALQPLVGKPLTPAQINAENAKFWAGR